MLAFIKTLTATQLLVYLGLWLVVTVLVNLVGHKSQVDAWCEAHPKVAGVFKMLRALGLDPWLLVQGLTLVLKGRLPAPLRRVPVLLALFTAVMLTGCAGTFEEARLFAASPATKTDASYCRNLDSKRVTWGAVGKGTALLAGSSGLATLPVEDRTAKAAIGGAALGLGAMAAVSFYVAEQEGALWARDCSR